MPRWPGPPPSTPAGSAGLAYPNFSDCSGTRHVEHEVIDRELLRTDGARADAAAAPSGGPATAAVATSEANRAVPCSFMEGMEGMEGRAWVCGGGRSCGMIHQDGMGVKISLEGVVCSLSGLARHPSTASPGLVDAMQAGGS